jgi:outer membrane protein assembly factor BamB
MTTNRDGRPRRSTPAIAGGAVAVSVAFIISTAVVLSAGPSGATAVPAPDPWRQGGFDAASTSYNSAEGELVPSTVGQLVRKWRTASPDGGAIGGMAASAHTVYVATAGGIFAYSIKTGRADRRYRLGSAVTVPGTILLSDTQLITTVGPELVSINRDSGRQTWTVQARDTTAVSQAWSAVILAGDAIYAVLSTTSASTGVTTEALDAISAATGDPLWTANGVFGPIAADAEKVYAQGVGTAVGPDGFDHTVVALHAKTGKPAWSVPLATSQILTDVVVSGRTVIAGAGGSAFGKEIYAMSAANGTKKWSHTDQATGKYPESPAGEFLVTNGKRLSYLSAQSHLVTLLVRTGRLLWKQPASQIGAVGGGGLVYVRLSNGRDRAYRLTNGKIRWTSIRAGFRPYLVADGHLVVGGSSLVAFGLR